MLQVLDLDFFFFFAKLSNVIYFTVKKEDKKGTPIQWRKIKILSCQLFFYAFDRKGFKERK